MSITPSEPEGSTSGNKAPYRVSLVNRSHQILKMGFDLLDASSLADSEEEVITGRLTKAMQDALEDLQAPAWTKNFSAVEETRVNDGEREGKRRLRIDIEVIHHVRGPRPRFRFEAKRLRDTDSRRNYLGDEGLGCFLDGRYAAADIDAGMLGYVQSGEVGDHAIALSEALLKDATRYKVLKEGGWREHFLVKGLQTYTTSHRRAKNLSDIFIIHTLLCCSGQT